MRKRLPDAIGASLAIVVCWGCSGNSNEVNPNAGGDSSIGGAATGGVSTVGSSVIGGASAGGGAPSTGGVAATGGVVSTGGRAATGGSSASGGGPATGGRLATGGSSATGGNHSTGGFFATGGTPATGGMPATGGTKAAGGAQTTGGSATYSPCPTNGDACKILPLGDSITWGAGYEGGYRIELFTKAVNAQQKITFTGSLSNGPTTVANTTFPQKNEGHNGWTITQDTGQIPSPALDTGSGGVPHIILVHLGTNDIGQGATASTMTDRLGTLIDKLVNAAPNALIVVAKITPLKNTSYNSTATSYNAAIPGAVQTRATAGKHVIVADMNTGFTSAMLSSDGVHPNQSGYSYMGDQWYSLVSNVLSK